MKVEVNDCSLREYAAVVRVEVPRCGSWIVTEGDWLMQATAIERPAQRRVTLRLCLTGSPVECRCKDF